MIQLKTAIRNLNKRLDAAKHLADIDKFQLVFNEDPSFDPFRASFWIRNKSDELALRKGYYPCLETALRWANLYPTMLCHTRGDLIGKPFFLLPWQRDDVILPMMAWRTPKGTPRVRKADLFCAKKNGKTTMCTGVIVGKMLEGKPNIECYNTAFTKSQAAKLFRDSALVIDSSPAIKDLFEIRQHNKRMKLPGRHSFLQTLPGEAGKKAAEGIDATLAIMDEIHLMLNRELYDFVELSGLAQSDALFLSVSTVGKISPTAIWTERHKYAKQWHTSKIIDLHYWGRVYEADPIVATDPAARRDLRQLAKANPSMKVDGRGILDPDILLNEVTEAENNPAKLRNVLQKVFNIPVASNSQKCIPIDKWRECAGELPDLAGRRCFLGLDVASHEDLAALSAYFPLTEEEKEQYLNSETLEILGFTDDSENFSDDDDGEDQIAVPPGFVKRWVFAPSAKIAERTQKGEVHYQKFVDSGELTETRGGRISFAAIKKIIRKCIEDFEVAELAYDRWGAEAIIQFVEEKFPHIECIQVDQTYGGMSLGCQSFLTLIYNGAIIHEGGELMEWCCGNVTSSERNGAIRFNKDESQDKIDPVISDVMAVGRACLAGEYYEPADYYDGDGNISEAMYL